MQRFFFYLVGVIYKFFRGDFNKKSLLDFENNKDLGVLKLFEFCIILGVIILVVTIMKRFL